MNEECRRRDLLGSGMAPWLLWLLPIATIALTGRFADREWVLTVSWTLALLVMSVLFANAGRCGRTHCYFQAPFFLFLKAATEESWNDHEQRLGFRFA
jgi:hypothetical protein